MIKKYVNPFCYDSFYFRGTKKNELIVGKVKDSQKCNLTTCRQNALQEI